MSSNLRRQKTHTKTNKQTNKKLYYHFSCNTAQTYGLFLYNHEGNIIYEYNVLFDHMIQPSACKNILHYIYIPKSLCLRMWAKW